MINLMVYVLPFYHSQFILKENLKIISIMKLEITQKLMIFGIGKSNINKIKCPKL